MSIQSSVDIRDLAVWIDQMPGTAGANPVLHVQGRLLVGNPGVSVTLGKGNPSSRPGVRVLELQVYQAPGLVIQVIHLANFVYQETLEKNQPISEIEVYMGNQLVVVIDSIKRTF